MDSEEFQLFADKDQDLAGNRSEIEIATPSWFWEQAPQAIIKTSKMFCTGVPSTTWLNGRLGTASLQIFLRQREVTPLTGLLR